MNVERSRHLERVLPFLIGQNPDIVCIQELCELNIPAFENALGVKCLFTPLKHNGQDGPLKTEGLGVFSLLRILSSGVDFYVGNREYIPTYGQSSDPTKQMSDRCALVSIAVEKDDVEFRVATTHFAWTPDGQPDEFQLRAFEGLKQVLETKSGLILCGDFNAPRGGEIFSALARQYTDNIPQKYITSLDRKLHRAGHLDLMVDGLFTTSEYAAMDVELVCDISDHCAVTANLIRLEANAQKL
ncbi:MAG: endonuclease/exonuclease/phosphatase family protein [Patescibacteria group bacterium]